MKERRRITVVVHHPEQEVGIIKDLATASIYATDRAQVAVVHVTKDTTAGAIVDSMKAAAELYPIVVPMMPGTRFELWEEPRGHTESFLRWAKELGEAGDAGESRERILGEWREELCNGEPSGSREWNVEDWQAYARLLLEDAIAVAG